MTIDKNDMIPSDPAGKLPDLLDTHLRKLLPDENLQVFSEQLPLDFLNDASEGLDNLTDSRQLESVMQQLNQQMHQQLSHKKSRKRKSFIWDLSWTYWAIIIVLLLTVTGFIVVRMFMNR